MTEEKLQNSSMESGHCTCSQSMNRPSEKASRPMGKKAKKGIFGRWLDRLGRVNEKEFGSNGPTCCN